MMLFQRSRALMMIIIIINGTARELTNNGEQMIPSWPKKKKKSLYACRKLNRSFPGNLKLRCLSQNQLVVFLFLCGELKVQKSNYFQFLHCHMKQNRHMALALGLKLSCNSHFQTAPTSNLGFFHLLWLFQLC